MILIGMDLRRTPEPEPKEVQVKSDPQIWRSRRILRSWLGLRSFSSEAGACYGVGAKPSTQSMDEKNTHRSCYPSEPIYSSHLSIYHIYPSIYPYLHLSIYLPTCVHTYLHACGTVASGLVLSISEKSSILQLRKEVMKRPLPKYLGRE